MTEKFRKRVVVAMSGGVDSSVAAHLLKEEGHDVVGVSLKVWDDGEALSGKAKTCCSTKDIDDARSVCDRLKIPFYAFNYKKEFQGAVIDKFVAEYSQGRTPNPCILCNHAIKFGRLMDEAEKLEADFVATGHHARIVGEANGRYRLIKGVDAEKDQSYVLYRLSQGDLAKILLPVGHYTKQEIRDIAFKAGLKTASKPESQDICFLPDGDLDRFIRKIRPDLAHGPGFFVDRDGKILGRHKGVHAYTIGQRRGLGIGFGDRRYVTRIDPVKNEVELGEDRETLSSGLIARNVNWIISKPTLSDWRVLSPVGIPSCSKVVGGQPSVRPPPRAEVLSTVGDEGLTGPTTFSARAGALPPAPPAFPPLAEGVLKWVLRCGVKIRYQKDEIPAEIVQIAESVVAVRFKKPARAVTPGQAAVFYVGEEVVGGGTIESAIR